ncbi:MAG: saccharopine dehydrogenase C-terminal domain-containing protein [Polyangiaceae bacterium]
MKRVLVLGAGMVGSAMAMDLAAQGFAVTVADVRDEALARTAARYGVATLRRDLSDPAAVRDVCAPFDLVCGALSSAMGLQTLRAVLEAGKDYVDISFMAENAWELSDLAHERGVTAVVDMGVSPGTSNIMAGWAVAHLDSCESIDILVGGLPEVRRWPFQYKAPFAASDVIEEYLRPARMVEHGRLIDKPALSEPELVDFDGVGTLEAFNTDGLRSLAYTLKVPFMREKTMRWPGHVELMRVFRETGLFSSEPIDVGGASVRPVDLVSRLLFPKWQYDEGEVDITVARVTITGKRHGEPVRLRWDLLDRHDPATGLRSMSRTTAFPATIVAGLLASGRFRRPGVHPPEVLGAEPGVLDHVLAELARRGVRYTAHHA